MEPGDRVDSDSKIWIPDQVRDDYKKVVGMTLRRKPI
jgi:hypothetical protein